MTEKTHLENAQILRRETEKALRPPFPSVVHIKLIVLDLVGQVEAHAAAVDRLEILHKQLIEVQDKMRIMIDA